MPTHLTRPGWARSLDRDLVAALTTADHAWLDAQWSLAGGPFGCMDTSWVRTEDVR